jgi:FkbM family methyltransferase
VYRENVRLIVRDKVKYEVDLSEGIDLSLFLFGGFQKHICRSRYLSPPKDGIIFDIGANFGAMTLRFAGLVPFGRVYAFEPTFYAFERLKKNISLNPVLAARITAVQSFVSSSSSDRPAEQVYASWKVGGADSKKGHKMHGGVKKSVQGVPTVSIDEFCLQQSLHRMDLIKIDTDGYEFEVLKGAEKIIKSFSPVVIFETALYVLQERGIEFGWFLNYFEGLDYTLINSSNDRRITARNIKEQLPLKSTVDIIALPAIGRPDKAVSSGG